MKASKHVIAQDCFPGYGVAMALYKIDDMGWVMSFSGPETCR